MSNTEFRPVRGTQASINALPITDGYVYYAVDTGRIFMDKGDQRISMGGGGAANGSSIYFGTYGQEIKEDAETKMYNYPIDGLEDDDAEPRVDDMILDDNGSLYRIKRIGEEFYYCTLLPLSGNGGSAPTKIRPTITLNDIENSIIINKQPFDLYFVVKSVVEESGAPLANKLTVYWTLIDTDSGQAYYTGIPITANHNEVTKLSLGSYLKESTDTTIELYATGINHEEPSALKQANVTTVEMYLEQTSRYDPSYKYDTSSVGLECNVIGNLSKILEWSIDGGDIKHTVVLGANSTNPQTFSPVGLSHGHHTVEVNVYQNLGDANKPIKGLPAEPLIYEIATVETGNEMPIIWLGSYQDTYFNYDTIQIPFLVYNPANTSEAEVHFYKNDVDINDGEPITIRNFDDYYYWQIADAELNRENYYSISCGKTDATTAVREIKFKVIPDPNRDMTVVKKNSLKLNFDPAGRSNSEPAARRASWSYTKDGETVNARFENFNWYNNGWYTDSETKSTYLRISNGAKFTIPFNGGLEFGTSLNSKQSNAIELAFKVRNIQNYTNLITNVTRYNVPTAFGDDGKPTSFSRDDSLYTAFTNQTLYSNYDAYLQATITDPEIYDNLQFREVQKNINLSNVVFGFYSGNEKSTVGVCVGSQDTFFSNGFDTVNVSFVEGEMVYLSFVYEHTPAVGSKLYIYINGCITGVIESSITGDTGFKITSNEIVFNSETCDIDLYKMRIYNTALTVNDIVTNHAVDKKNITIYDQNGLASENNTLQEFQLDFNKILDWNKEHPELPLMPYIIYDTSSTTSDDKLPYAKANGATKIKVDFVNTPLDTAYARGELVRKAVEDGLLDENETDQDTIDEAVRTYYQHHCPSWTSSMSVNDTVGLEVQGTSSEFYPRRNFKIKTKFKKPNSWGLNEDTGVEEYLEEECLNIFMNKGPFEEIYASDKEKLKADEHYYGYEESRMADGWYMNNYTNATDRWTMKVDYMESSGSYNAGFASLVANAYTKHPLSDYQKVITNTSKLNSKISNEIRWQDYRTSLLGFPVMAFHKRKKKGSTTGETECVFIGYYRMLLDKGSDKVLGFKPDKKIEHTLVGNKKLRDVAECWEFSTNARTFTSYRDPWGRVELSFKAPRSIGDAAFIKLEGNKIGGPVVLNHFEPRYFKYKDYLANDEDGFYNFGNLEQDTVNEICADIGVDPIDVSSANAKYEAQDVAVDVLMKNWEKVCKWVYSTNLDDVKSQGTYSKVPVGKTEYIPGQFYIMDEEAESGYSICNDVFDPTQTYYETYEYKVEINKLDEKGNPILDEEGQPVKETVTREGFRNAYAVTSNMVYTANTFYVLVSDHTDEEKRVYALSADLEFDSSVTYYAFESLKDELIAERADLLVAPATAYDENTEYYSYNSDAKVISGGGKTGAVTYVGKVSADRYAANKYYVAAPKQYASTTYKYDTKEYRTAKFMNELKDHFDLEYLATYFIMTEVFECYDSRGKNCMMASWGPQKEGGDYVWYPIFYDIDTQLGINNTGIPSFEFNVDATEAGNYSTSDSILWNNFYKFFKGSQILNKYKNLRNQDSTFDKLDNPPLQSVEYLEKWYTFDPEVTNNIANKGERPLIATNLDMFYKYITITNPKAESQGVAYIPGADGKYDYDSDGTYFYALQGDRSQSRRQFLTNRLEYIDSWLNQGNYQRGGNNRIRGRISANSGVSGKTSDWWVETDDSPYWTDNEFGTKAHDFDAEYWLTLQPIRSAYVTAGDDSANYPSQKYDGKTAVKFKLSDIESGVRKSANYPEQLVYIYGMNQMADFGDMNKLYWTEFYMEGNADHLTRLQLGYDGYSRTPGESTHQWYNQKLNGIKLSSMPLLQEANFSNIGLDTQTSLDLTASEKLENFRAVGTSNLTGVNFADGVALNTLYLPKSVTSLKLVQANLLTNLIDESVAPTPTNNEDGSVTPPTQGLYIDGLFDEDDADGNPVNTSLLTSINLNGGSLGYGSYKILKKYYDTVDPSSNVLNRITMKDVKWCPYTQLTEGAAYDKDAPYYLNNKHYGFASWTPVASDFNDLVLNGQLYLYTGAPEVTVGDDFLEMIQAMQTTKKDIFADASSSEEHPIITGIVYVENNTYVEESWVREYLQPMYPNITFFFKNVTKAYSAQFLYKDPETGVDKYVKFANGSNEPSVQKISRDAYLANNNIWFTNPFTTYAPTRSHYDFAGWSTDPNADPLTEQDKIIKNVSEWNALKITENQYDYTYYAIFKIHSYDIIFYDGDGSTLFSTILPYDTPGIEVPSLIPCLKDDNIDLYLTNSFVGYTDNPLTNKLTDPTMVRVRGKMEFWPVFEQVDVYTNIHPEYFTGTFYTGQAGKGVELSLAKQVQGKITIPVKFKMEDGEEYPVLALNPSFATTKNTNVTLTANGGGLTHVFFEKGTYIEEFMMYAFYGDDRSSTVSSLVYVEFPDTLLSIGKQCFYRCGLMDYRPVTKDASKLGSAVIKGANVKFIGEQAFNQAFKKTSTADTYSINVFNIGAKVEEIQSQAFANLGFDVSEFLMGSSSEKSQFVFTHDQRISNEGDSLTIYTDKYKQGQDEALFAKAFSDVDDIIIVN